MHRTEEIDANSPWGDIATCATAGGGAAAAFGAWRAADRSAKTADAVARIEEARWQSDLTPDFSLDLVLTGNGQAQLLIHLNGPDSLRHLDHICDRGR